MPRSEDTKTVSITMTPEQFRAFQSIKGNRSKIIRDLLRTYMQQQGLPPLPEDAPEPIELARTKRWTKPHAASS